MAYSRSVRSDVDALVVQLPDSVAVDSVAVARDTLIRLDSAVEEIFARADSINFIRDSVIAARKSPLDDVITYASKDSIEYDVSSKMVYIYEGGDINYQGSNLLGDFMSVDMQTEVVFATGRLDTVSGKFTRPKFSSNNQWFTMDTLLYSLNSRKARITGFASEEGEGFMAGTRVKKMPDNTLNIINGSFTTCNLSHPHFYIAMSKAKAIPGKKVIIGPSYLVMEDVPIYFLGIPFGFFPLQQEKNSGFIIPTVGEEATRGFYLRNGGYYLAFNDYVDLALTGGIYTYGSWEAQTASRYIKRYKYTGNLNFSYERNTWGDKGSPDYVSANSYKIGWAHQQDPRARPNTTFSSSVNFSSSNRRQFGATTIEDITSGEKNSSIAYSKVWPNSPFSLSTNMNLSQNVSDSSVIIGFPNVVFNMSRINPLKRREAIGKQRWYEKISMSYTGNFQNTIRTFEKDLFTANMFDNVRNGVNHQIPITTNMNILRYITISPNFNYQERWYFEKQRQEWDPVNEQVVKDTVNGFFRLYNYNFSVSASTRIFGTYQFRNPKSRVKAFRHVVTPSVSLNYVPDFSSQSFQSVQIDAEGNMREYQPFAGGIYGAPGRGKTFAIGFSLQQTLSMKLRDRDDPTDPSKDKIINLIDQLSISSSYNFIPDSLNLAPFSISLRTKLLKNVGLNVNATLDPYQIDENGRRINKFMLSKGTLGRLTRVSTAFGYSFSSSKSTNPAGVANDINTTPIPGYSNPFDQTTYGQTDPNLIRQSLTAQYYDFNIPWNIGFNYSFNYSKEGLKSNLTQTLGFNGSVNLTDKWGVVFNGGYDIQARRPTIGTISVTRDLHCWQMFFSCIPYGTRKSWSFTIQVKASMLKDLKYERRNSFMDNRYLQ